MHRPLYLLAFIMTICGAVAFAQDAGPLIQADQNKDRPGQTPAPPDRGDAAQPAGDRAAGLSQQGSQEMDRDFIKSAASGNMLEVQVGQLVSERAQDPQVKQFAQRLIEDHRKANDQLKQVAQALNVDVSDDLMPVDQAKLEHYRQKQGRQLELGFIFGQVGHHYKDVLEYQFMAQNAVDPQLKQYASQALPHLRQHLQMAERIAPGGAEARTAGERVTPGDDTDSGHIGGPRGSDHGPRGNR